MAMTGCPVLLLDESHHTDSHLPESTTAGSPDGRVVTNTEASVCFPCAKKLKERQCPSCGDVRQPGDVRFAAPGEISMIIGYM